ncbi:PAXX protein, partial [Chunga burmeisteri]|nr:PAXX protein [Chunga burmeisteri]
MAEPAGPFHLLRAGPGQYLCYCRPAVPAGGARHEAQVGAAAAGIRPLRRGPPSPWPRPHREALERGAASLSLGEGKATLQLQEEARCSALDLFKLPIAEARSQLQALVFDMARRVKSLERRLEGLAKQLADLLQSPSCLSLTEADPRPRKTRDAGSVLPAKRKIPGESLINPGFKSKKAPSGVDFEDS